MFGDVLGENKSYRDSALPENFMIKTFCGKMVVINYRAIKLLDVLASKLKFSGVYSTENYLDLSLLKKKGEYGC